MQIPATHEEQRARDRSLRTSLLGWGMKGSRSELLRFPGLKRKNTHFEGSQIFSRQTAEKIQKISSSVLGRRNSWGGQIRAGGGPQSQPILLVIDVFGQLCAASAAEESMKCSFSHV